MLDFIATVLLDLAIATGSQAITQDRPVCIEDGQRVECTSPSSPTPQQQGKK